MTDFSTIFLPDPHRVTSLDQLMRKKLTESLHYLYSVIQDQIDIPPEAFESGINTILSHPVLPDVFAAYYELAYATEAGDLDKAEGLLREILSMKEPKGLDLFPFKARELAPRSLRYVTPVDTDPAVPFPILPVQPQDFQRASQLIHDSFALLKEIAPNLHDELKALLRAIMIGSGPTNKKAYTFDGASAFELWGAILLNAIEAKDIVDMVQTLAHESCHVMLFGFCIDDRLVLNPDSDRYPSPLRADPRPIDGIYHAVYVLARMFYASTAIIEKSNLSKDLITKAEDSRKGFTIRFYDGLGTLKEHAEYTDTGRALMDNAQAYMDEYAKHLIE